MKKIIIILFIILSLTACNKQKIKEDDIVPINEEKEEIVEDTYIDDNPIKVGLYQNNKLVHSYSTELVNNQDITSFDIYLTQDEEIQNNKQLDNWNYYYNKYQDIDKYKVGFNISFTTEDKEVNQTITDPTTMHSMGPYMFIYLYDDIKHANDSWYSHIEENEFNDETIISSIKLYLSGEGTKITSSIYLTVFTYDQDDFDDQGNYRGNSKYTIEIKTN